MVLGVASSGVSKSRADDMPYLRAGLTRADWIAQMEDIQGPSIRPFPYWEKWTSRKVAFSEYAEQ